MEENSFSLSREQLFLHETTCSFFQQLQITDSTKVAERRRKECCSPPGQELALFAMQTRVCNAVCACMRNTTSCWRAAFNTPSPAWIFRTDTRSNLKIREVREGNGRNVCRQGQWLKSAGYSNINCLTDNLIQKFCLPMINKIPPSFIFMNFVRFFFPKELINLSRHGPFGSCSIKPAISQSTFLKSENRCCAVWWHSVSLFNDFMRRIRELEWKENHRTAFWRWKLR